MSLSKPVLIGIGALLLAGAFLLILVGGTYNSLVGADEDVNKAWSDVESQYQRRADLVPNLVASVKGAAEFERSTLQAVVDARSRVGQISLKEAPTAAQMQTFQESQNALGGALTRLLVVAENYPQLQATQAFIDLQAQLEGTENRIAVARQDYNLAAANYNKKRRGFPTVFLAGLLGFDARAGFESAPGAEDAPKVDFGGGQP